MVVERIHKGKTPPRIHFISEWMEKRGIRPADIVENLGVNKGTVSKWGAGALPSEDNVLALAALFEIDPNDLFRHPDDDWIARMFGSSPRVRGTLLAHDQPESPALRGAFFVRLHARSRLCATIKSFPISNF